jgi:hypothetical protein
VIGTGRRLLTHPSDTAGVRLTTHEATATGRLLLTYETTGAAPLADYAGVTGLEA